jgi:phage terminase small subunit
MPDWKKIKEEFETTAVTLQELADKYGISAGTVRSRKNREKWVKHNGATSNNTTGNAATRNATKATKKRQRNVAKKVANEFMIRPEDVGEGLTEMQRLFCFYYIKNHNATQAALKAGYTPKHPSELGYQLLRYPSVRTEIERLKRLRNEAIMLTQEDIVERYMQIAFADLTDTVEWGTEEVPNLDEHGCIQIGDDGRVKIRKVNTYMAIKNSSQVDGGLIKEISKNKHGIKIKLEDRTKALEWLANYFGMNPMDKHKIDFDNQVLKLRKKEVEAKVW